MRVILVGALLEENLALRSIRSSLENAGHEVEELAFNRASELDRTACEIVASNADLAGFSMVFTLRAREFAMLADRARALGFKGHLTAGGHFAAFNAEALLQEVSSFDSIACGEGEEIMLDILARLEDGHGLDRVSGLVWRGADRRIIRNPTATEPPDLDTRPSPTRCLPFPEYLGVPVANMLSSRGCSYACTFCSISAWHRLCGGQRFRTRSVDLVADEISHLYASGVRIFNFHDDNFLLRDRHESLVRVRALRQALRKRDVGRIAFAIKSRPGSVDEELFSLLRSMGLFRVFLGIEAGTAESLRRLGRKQSVAENTQALDVVQRLDLHACFNLLLLNPDSTLEDVAANIYFLRRHAGNPMNFCRTEVYAGTPLEARLRRDGRLLGDFWGYDYEISDHRAESFFQIMHRTFWERNHGKRSAQLQSMRVDYEHQLLSHFFTAVPSSRASQLRDRAKEYILAVNRNTCDYLDEAVAAVANEASRQCQADSVNHLENRLLRDNERLWEVGESLLAEIRKAAQDARPAGTPRWLRVAAVAGVAAGLVIGSAACERESTHPFESAPAPTLANEPLRAEATEKLLPLLIGRLAEVGAVELSFDLGTGGQVNSLKLRQGEADLPHGLPETVLAEVRLEASGATPGRYTITYTEEQVEEVRRSMWPPGERFPEFPPHVAEMAPRPPDRDE